MSTTALTTCSCVDFKPFANKLWNSWPCFDASNPLSYNYKQRREREGKTKQKLALNLCLVLKVMVVAPCTYTWRPVTTQNWIAICHDSGFWWTWRALTNVMVTVLVGSWLECKVALGGGGSRVGGEFNAYLLSLSLSLYIYEGTCHIEVERTSIHIHL